MYDSDLKRESFSEEVLKSSVSVKIDSSHEYWITYYSYLKGYENCRVGVASKEDKKAFSEREQNNDQAYICIEERIEEAASGFPLHTIPRLQIMTREMLDNTLEHGVKFNKSEWVCIQINTFQDAILITISQSSGALPDVYYDALSEPDTLALRKLSSSFRGSGLAMVHKSKEVRVGFENDDMGVFHTLLLCGKGD
jgi:anti-sigma regulatory factor (Ser/Thr protein kinase)